MDSNGNASSDNITGGSGAVEGRNCCENGNGVNDLLRIGKGGGGDQDNCGERNNQNGCGGGVVNGGGRGDGGAAYGDVAGVTANVALVDGIRHVTTTSVDSMLTDDDDDMYVNQCVGYSSASVQRVNRLLKLGRGFGSGSDSNGCCYVKNILNVEFKGSVQRDGVTAGWFQMLWSIEDSHSRRQVSQDDWIGLYYLGKSMSQYALISLL